MPALLAIAALCLGASVYLLDRGGNADFVPAWLAQALTERRVFGALAGSLPSFTHVFAFSLLTAAVLGRGRVAAAVACGAWVLVDASFELAQLDSVSAAVSAWLPNRAGAAGWLFGETRRFLTLGTFDVSDLCSVALGGLLAYWASTKRWALE